MDNCVVWPTWQACLTNVMLSCWCFAVSLKGTNVDANVHASLSHQLMPPKTERNASYCTAFMRLSCQDQCQASQDTLLLDVVILMTMNATIRHSLMQYSAMFKLVYSSLSLPKARSSAAFIFWRKAVSPQPFLSSTCVERAIGACPLWSAKRKWQDQWWSAVRLWP